MSEDKQLTVAELLARAEKQNPGGASSRPRRRRSLEEGGVSVAELTGSIKKVEAQPAEVKHSSVPLDAPAAPTPPKPTPTPKSEAPKAEPAKAEQPKREPAKAEQSKPEQPKPQPVKAGSVKPQPAKPEPSGVGEKGVGKQAAPTSDDTAVIRKVTAEPEKKTGTGSTKVAAPADTGVIPAVPAPAAESGLDEFGDREVEPAAPGRVAEREEADLEDEGTLNPIMLVLLVFAGLLLGVLGFFAFQWVWTNTSTIVSVLLAVVAVLAVVFGVRAMRTGRDGVTTTLAGVAAVVVAFGPALLV